MTTVEIVRYSARVVGFGVAYGMFGHFVRQLAERRREQRRQQHIEQLHQQRGR